MESVGLSSKQLHNVFPYHVVIDHELKIKQMGEKLSSFLSGSESAASALVGGLISDFFSIAAPPRCSWNWKQIILGKDSTWDIALISSKLGLKRLKKLPLRGSVLLIDSQTDSTQKVGAIFLLNPLVTSASDMFDCGLLLSDISRHSYQRQYLIIGTVQNICFIVINHHNSLVNVHRIVHPPTYCTRA
jgi:hypothetical protein